MKNTVIVVGVLLLLSISVWFAQWRSNTHSEPNPNQSDSWGAFTIEDLRQMVPQTEDGHFLLDVAQLYFSADDQELLEVLDGVSVQIEGEIAQQEKGGALDLIDYGPDVDPYKLPLSNQQSGLPLEVGGWYEVVGRVKYRPEEEGGKQIQIVTQQVKRIPNRKSNKPQSKEEQYS